MQLFLSKLIILVFTTFIVTASGNDVRRYLLLISTGDGEPSQYVGSVAINDRYGILSLEVNLQRAQVSIEFRAQPDGQVVNFTFTHNGREFNILNSGITPSSPIINAFINGVGIPSSWPFDQRSFSYQFHLPNVESLPIITLDQRGINYVGLVQLAHNQGESETINDARINYGNISFQPGDDASGRTGSQLVLINNSHVLQVIEIAMVAFMLPSMVRGAYQPFDQAPPEYQLRPTVLFANRRGFTSRGTSSRRKRPAQRESSGESSLTLGAPTLVKIKAIATEILNKVVQPPPPYCKTDDLTKSHEDDKGDDNDKLNCRGLPRRRGEPYCCDPNGGQIINGDDGQCWAIH